MEKERIIIWYRKIFLLATGFIFLYSTLSAQTYTSLGEQTVSWSVAGAWSVAPGANFLNGIIDQATTVIIDGTIDAGNSSLPLSISISDDLVLTINTGDTLVIWGDLDFSAGSSAINLNGALIVHGNLTIGSSAVANINGNSGFLGIEGDFNNTGSCAYTSNGSNVYIIGTTTEPISCDDPFGYTPPSVNGACEYGNLFALLNTESTTTQQLVLGADESLTVVLTQTQKIACFNGNEGEITANAYGGSWAGYEFSFESGAYSSTNVFSNLVADTFHISARDNALNTASAQLIIELPDTLMSGFVNYENFVCNADDSTGVINVDISGGWAPYDTVLYREGVVYNHSYDSLCTGTYYVIVTDSAGCTAQSANLVVGLDTQYPTFINFPDDYYQNITAYDALNSNDVIVYLDDTVRTYTGITDTGYVTPVLNLSYYDSLRFSITATQVDATVGWTNNDSISVQVSYNGGADYVPLWIDKCVWHATYDNVGEAPPDQPGNPVTTSISLPIYLGAQADLNSAIRLKVIASIGAPSLQYQISELSIMADERAHLTDTIVSGSPKCNDDYVCAISYSDGLPQWLCETVGSEEFYIERTWTVTDSCGKEDSRGQRLMFGTPPVLDMTNNADTIWDVCRNIQSITAPVADDECTPASVSVSWVITDEATGDTLSSNVNNIVNYSFPVGDTVIVYWTATDQVGITTTEQQRIIVMPEISVSFYPVPVVGDICLQQEVVFELSVSGGTGVYDFGNFSFSPAGGDWSNPYYTTSGLTNLQKHLEVIVGDLNDPGEVDGGCSSTQTSGDFTIHDLIETQSISRD